MTGPRIGPKPAAGSAFIESDRAHRIVTALAEAHGQLVDAACEGGSCTFGREKRHARHPETYCAPCLVMHQVTIALRSATIWRREALAKGFERARGQR